jgi:hypothetical protein
MFRFTSKVCSEVQNKLSILLYGILLLLLESNNFVYLTLTKNLTYVRFACGSVWVSDIKGGT